MPARLPRSVPWTSTAEWEQVYSWLYAPPEFPHLYELGIKRVKAWASRGKVPHAIDATAAFLEITLRDRLPGSKYGNVIGVLGGVGSLSEYETRLLYSMAFVRFINGLVDPLQRGQYATSIYGHAETLNLPSWFVDLRHACTHDAHLPSLPLLRSGCIQALDWLHSNYWLMQKSYVADATEQVRELLGAYVKARRGVLGVLEEDGK
ncbi:rRNA-processing protein las1, partial [Quaeritorhiza haematococci]